MAVGQPNTDNLKLRLTSMAILGCVKLTKLVITSIKMFCFSTGQETSVPNEQKLQSPQLGAK